METPYTSLNNYKILKNLARTSVTSVSSAEDPDKKLVCVKAFIDRDANYNHQSWEEELALLKELEGHPGIMQALSVCSDEFPLWFSMELMEGDLSDALCRFGGQIPPEMRHPAQRQLLDALTFIHSKGIIHGDIKPENILYRGHNVKITDFNYSVRITDKWNGKYVPCSKDYRPPEWLAGIQKSYKFTIDTWALGAVFAEMNMGYSLFILRGLDDLERLEDIFLIVGYPSRHDWPHLFATNIPRSVITKPDNVTEPSRVFSDDPKENALICKMLVCNPKDRLGAAALLLFLDRHSRQPLTMK